MPSDTTPSGTRQQPIKDDDFIKIMLVDDSSLIRSMVTKILSTDGDFKVVNSVSNGQIAVDTIENVKPDVLLLDIEMPVMDGLTALPILHKKSPHTKIVIFSALSEKGADVTIKGLSLGAADYLLKPSSFSQTDPALYQKELISIIKGLGKTARRRRLARSMRTPLAATAEEKKFTLRNDKLIHRPPPSIIAIGSSTGGPMALPVVLKHLSGINLPIIITQHMPPKFTAALANNISKKLNLDCVEAQQNMLIEPGRIYIAPGGVHMTLKKSGASVFVELDDGPKESFCKPSIEPMLRSAIDIYGNKIFMVMLTGMGKDGFKGCKTLIEKGGRMIAQDEKSSIVWGMPGAVAMEGLCSAVLPLDKMGPWIANILK